MPRCFILASGPSLDGFDFGRLDGEITIGINYICRYYKPTVLVFGDMRVYTGDCNIPSHSALIDYLDCVKVTKKGNPPINEVYRVPLSNRFNGENGLRDGLYQDYMTGVWALSLAIALRFNPIFLLGYDCQFKNGQGHFYSKDFTHKGDSLESAFKQQATLFNAFKNWPGIYNCSSISLLTQFPKVDIDKILETRENVDIAQIKGYIKGELEKNR
ncbi:MAG: hypothetical protein QME51_01950 [Planctomycetota bacterium]|nr:hypothetical protein [Planctomycetota bacterium]